MGLGKTLTMIALIAIGLHSSASRNSGHLPTLTSDDGMEPLKTTLVILPLSRGSPFPNMPASQVTVNTFLKLLKSGQANCGGKYYL